MTPGSVLRAVARAMAAVVLVASGVYILVYLWRWEWQRAIISGVFFLAALIIVSTLVTLHSIARLSREVDRLEASGRIAPAQRRPDVADRTAATLRRSSSEHAARHFDWLKEPPDRLGVFVPILLGTGALLSGLAYLIERLAGVMATSTVDRSTIRLLAPDLPLGDTDALVGVGTPAPAGPQRSISGIATAAAVAATIGGAVILLMLLTQNRADVPVEGDATVIELQFDQRGRERRPADELASALWIACRSRVSTDVSPRSLVETGSGVVRLELDTPLGEFGRRRLVGCLEDATIDRVQATVLTVDTGWSEQEPA